MCNLHFGRCKFGKVQKLLLGIWHFRNYNLSWFGQVLLSSARNPTCVNHPIGATYHSINYSEHWDRTAQIDHSSLVDLIFHKRQR